MKLNEIIPEKGSIKKKKRLGRGQSSGKGGTSTRGHKGAKSRSGNNKKIGFEGGQMPLQRRVPKFGFKGKNKKKYQYLNLDFIQKLYDSGKIYNNIVNREFLIKKGILHKNSKLKILAKGKLTAKLTIISNNFSKNSIKIIRNLGGEAIYI